MAHYLQEKISESEAVTGEDRKIAKKECFETILMLWEYRSNYPYKLRPFIDTEKIIDVIEYLDPKKSDSFYYWMRNDKKSIPEKILPNIENIVSIDYFARLMITFFINEATTDLTDDSMKEWMEFNDEITVTAESRILIKIAPDFDGINSEENDFYDKKEIELESHLKKIDEFEHQLLDIKKCLKLKLEAVQKAKKT